MTRSFIYGLALVAVGCATEIVPFEKGPEPEVRLEAPNLRRLTVGQYAQAARSVLGEQAFVPVSLEADVEVSGLIALGASVVATSPLGVERYEAAGMALGAQVMGDPEARARLVSCTPAGPVDAGCAEQSLRPMALRAWRRPATEEELGRLVAVANEAGEVLGDFHQGLGYAIGAMLQSPYFLFRDELGEPDGDGRRLDAYGLATKLSYFLLNAAPDEALLTAASEGRLDTEEGLAEVVDELLADPRVRDGVRAIFDDVYALRAVPLIVKDPTIFPAFSANLGPSAREEALLNIEEQVLGVRGDVRDLFVTRRTHVDRKLASVYGLPAPDLEGFAPVSFPDDQARMGLLGQVAFLAGSGHATSTSVTLRGRFVRERVLCQRIPPPPAGVDTSIPEVTDRAPTMRDRVAQHLADPACASCHQLMDPIGLAFEPFDGIGIARSMDNGSPIDPSGDLDGVEYDDAEGLAWAVHDHKDLGPCLTERLWEYGNGREISGGEGDFTEWLARGFAGEGYRVDVLMREIATSAAFRQAGEVQ